MLVYGVIAWLTALFATILELDVFQTLTKRKTPRNTPWTWMIISPVVAAVWALNFAGFDFHNIMPIKRQKGVDVHNVVEENRKVFNDPAVQRGAKLFAEFQRQKLVTANKSDREIMMQTIKAATMSSNRP